MSEFTLKFTTGAWPTVRTLESPPEEFEDYGDIEAARAEVVRLRRELKVALLRAEVAMEKVDTVCIECGGDHWRHECERCGFRACRGHDRRHFAQGGCPTCADTYALANKYKSQFALQAARERAQNASNKGARSKALARVKELRAEAKKLTSRK